MDNVQVIQHIYEEHIFTNYPSFPQVLRPHQARAIQETLNGFDLICLLPTSYGKTLAMLAPPIIIGKMANKKCVHLIISPLLALSADMMNNLQFTGLGGFNITGTTPDLIAMKELWNATPDGDVFHIITSPELLSRPDQKDFLKDANVQGFSVDEGHVVSLWSPEFRRAYSGLHQIRAYVKCSIAVFSATVTPYHKLEIMEKVGFRPYDKGSDCEPRQVLLMRPNTLQSEVWLVRETYANLHYMVVVVERCVHALRVGRTTTLARARACSSNQG